MQPLLAAIIERSALEEPFHVPHHRISHRLDRRFGGSPKQPLEQLRIGKGTRLNAQLKPCVMETSDGPVEVADLFFDNGATARSMPFDLFSFVD